MAKGKGSSSGKGSTPKSAVSGKFVSRSYANSHPNTTYTPKGK